MDALGYDKTDRIVTILTKLKPKTQLMLLFER